MTHPRRNIITASLRGDAGDLVRVSERVPIVGDRWLLCSDGVSDYLPDADIRALVTGILDPADAARRIVELSLEAGSRDNVTAVVCDLTAAPEPEGAVPLVAGSAALRYPEVFEAGLVATA